MTSGAASQTDHENVIAVIRGSITP